MVRAGAGRGEWFGAGEGRGSTKVMMVMCT